MRYGYPQATSLGTATVVIAALGCGSVTPIPAGEAAGGARVSSESGAPGTSQGGAAGGGLGGVPSSVAGNPTGLGGSGTVTPSTGGTGIAGKTGGSAGQTAAGGTLAGQGGGQGGSSGTAAGGSDGGTGSGNGGAGGSTTGSGGATSAPMPGPNDIWISPNGSDGATGTRDMPLRSLAAAVQRTKPGLTIWVNAGTYPISQTVSLKANGQADAPLRVFAAPGERPIFDFAAQPRGDSSARGIQISGDYWHLRGLDVIDAGDNCINVSGAHNTIESVVVHGCSDTGIQITASSSEASDPARAAYNTILNCDSYDNYDAANQGENADGFAAKLYIGPGNVFRGCRAWNNADDGWDLFASNDVVVIESCWAIANGKIGAGQNNTNGDGNGFKLGGAPTAGDANMGGAVHRVTNCVSIENRACGFVRNNNPDEPMLGMCGGRGDGKGTFCSLASTGVLSPTLSAADAIAAKRDANGNLPAVR